MLSKAYILVALPCVVACALFVPPNEVPDEMTHLLRAEQLAEGRMQGVRRCDESAGGQVDSGVAAFVDHYANGAGRASPEEWHFTGFTTYAHFPNTVRYPPFLYTPVSAALWTSRLLKLGVKTAFYAARLANGVAAVLLTSWALALARRGQWFLFALGLMPMALFEMGSVCQDAGLIALALLLAALVTRLPSASASMYWAVAGLITVMAGARPPLLGLAVVLVLLGWGAVPWRHRLLAPLACVGAVVAWSAMTAKLQVSMRPGVPSSIGPHLAYLSRNPAAVPTILVNTLFHPDTNWLKTFIGVLGWLTVHLSVSGYIAAAAALLLALACCAQEKNPCPVTDRLLVTLGILVTFAGMLLTTYLTWTPVGADRVDGIQGRYFYGFLPLLVVLVPAWAPGTLKRWLAPPWRLALITACLAWLLLDSRRSMLRAWGHERVAGAAANAARCVGQACDSQSRKLFSPSASSPAPLPGPRLRGSGGGP